MSPYYGNPGYDLYFAQMFGTILVVSLIVGLIGWVLQGFGPYKMAKNAGIPNPWLAFIPLGQGYLLGLLAQRSLYASTGQQKPLAQINLWLPIALLAGGLVTGVLVAMVPLLGALLSLVLVVGSLVVTYYLFYTYYHLFKDYAPDNAVLFLILTILFSPLAFIIITLLYMDVVPVSVAGRVPYGQPKYNQRGNQPHGYGPQGPGGYGPQGPESPYQPQDRDNHRGPEL